VRKEPVVIDFLTPILYT